MYTILSLLQSLVSCFAGETSVAHVKMNKYSTKSHKTSINSVFTLRLVLFEQSNEMSAEDSSVLSVEICSDKLWTSVEDPEKN